MEVALILFGLAIDAAFIIVDHKYHNWMSIILKTLASIVFVFLGVYESRNLASSAQCKFIWGSLVFNLFGDFTLILRNVDKKHKDLIFILGMLFFMISHFFLLALLIIRNSGLLITSVLITAVLFAVIVYIILKKIETSKTILFFGLVYLYVIILVFVYALMIYLNSPNTFNLIFTIGYFLFMSSDIILTFQKFDKNAPTYLQPIYRALYYVSQIITAVAIKFM